MYELRPRPISRQFLLNNQKFFQLINEAYSVILLADYVKRLDILIIIFRHIRRNLTLVLDKRYTQDEQNVHIIQLSLNMIEFIEDRLSDGKKYYHDDQLEKFEKVTSYLRLKMKGSVYKI